MRVLELFAGYGSQALALENLGIDFTSDISEIDKYAIQAYNQLHGISNSQLYKLAGNSIVVDVLMGIFKNLLQSDEGTKGQLTLL